MFVKIAVFEFRYQTRQPVFWVFAVLMFLTAFGSVASDNVSMGSSMIHRNAALQAAFITGIMSLFYMFVAIAFVSSALLRDDDTGFGPILHSTGVGRAAYVLGRFAGAFAAAAAGFLSIEGGLLVGGLMPWIDKETLGPFNFSGYLWSLFIIGYVSLLFICSLFFCIAAATRSRIATYIASIGVLAVWLSGLNRNNDFQPVAAIIDPFGVQALMAATRYWSPVELNAGLPALDGLLLANRLLWLGAGLVSLAAAFFTFRMRLPHPAPRRRVRDWLRFGAAPGPAAPKALVTAQPKARFDSYWALAQFIARLKLDLAQVFSSPAYFVLVLVGLFLGAINMWFGFEHGGVVAYPLTRAMITILERSYDFLPQVIAVYYAGELVWRERDRRMHEIIDATPAEDWSFLAPRIGAVALVLFSTHVLAGLEAVFIQAAHGYFDVQLGHYLNWYVWGDVADDLLIALLAVFFQTLAPTKVAGWGLMIGEIVFSIVLEKNGFDHVLIDIFARPGFPLSDMNAGGRYGTGAVWVRLYWCAFSGCLAVLSYMLWTRGVETRLTPRLARLRGRLASPAGAVLALGLCLFAGFGVYVFLNTNVWNAYRSAEGWDRYAADREKALSGFVNLPRPTITRVLLDVDLHPHTPKLVAKGAYQFVNNTGKPLTELHISFDPEVDVIRLSAPGARLKTYLPLYNYSLYAFDAPLMPGEVGTLYFEAERAPKGFRNAEPTTVLNDNGTFITDAEFAPSLGPNPDSFLHDRIKRRRYGLTPDFHKSSPDAPGARDHNALTPDADWITADISVTTDADQTPIAPGDKVSDVTEGGRRTARFRTESPILRFFSIQSAVYSRASQSHNGVDLSVFYDARSAHNVDHMLDVLKTSLDVYSDAFGPYQFKQLRIVEFPGYRDLAQSFANTIPYSENLGFAADLRDPSKLDIVAAVVSHEAAHQWWGHQLAPADAQGAEALSESLAQYSMMLTLERLYGPEKLRRFTKYALDRYLRGRGADSAPERPLARVEAQPFVYYEKAALVFGLLKDRMGAAAVNRALRRLLDDYAFKGPPYATTTDLLAALRAEAPAEAQDLITDLFERITLYDFKAVSAQTRRRADGLYLTTLVVTADKTYADGQGRQTSAPLKAAVDVGLFRRKPSDADFTRSDVLALHVRTLRGGRQSLGFVTRDRPAFAAVDPYVKYIDRNTEDNIIPVS